METIKHIPPITSVEHSVWLYYAKNELGNAEIRGLFGDRADATICRLKELAREVQRERDVKTWQTYTVNTECAYEAWGLDVEDLEKRAKKLQKLMKREVG